MPRPVCAFNQNQPFAEHRQDSGVCVDLEEMAELVVENLPYQLVIEEADSGLWAEPVQERRSCMMLE